MRAAGLALLAAGMIATAAASPAEARDYRYCLQTSIFDGPSDCSYDTYAQCRATASGLYADCVLNPRMLFMGEPRPQRRHRAHRARRGR